MESATAEDAIHLIPGASIAGGRYRLLVFHGGPPALQFWQALDTALDRQVALTFVDPDRTLPDDELQEILSRTLRLSRIDMPGYRPCARCRAHRRRRSGGRRVDPGRVAAGGGRHLPVAGRRRARHPVAGRGGRRRPPCRRCVVDRSPEPASGQHRGRCGAGVPSHAARCHPRGRHPRYRCCPVCAADQSLAAGRGRHTQRAAVRGPRPGGAARRAALGRPQHPLPDLGRRRAFGAGWWWNQNGTNAFEPSPAVDRSGRPHRADRARRRPGQIGPTTDRARKHGGHGGPRPQAARGDDRVGHRGRHRRGGVDRARIGAEQDVRRRRRRHRRRSTRAQPIVIQFHGLRWRRRRQHRQTRSRHGVLARGRGATRRVWPVSRSTAIRPPYGRPTPIRTPPRSPGSRTASA